ncbi:MAG: flagellar motor protein MotD [Comamonadaceae bacterium]
MRRRRNSSNQGQTGSQDRWLVSYADFITLMFALFVVMYGLSSVSEGKFRVLGDSLFNAFGSNVVRRLQPPTQPATPDLAARSFGKPPEPQAKQREQMRGLARDILMVMDELVRDGQVRVTQTNWGISVEINASVLFASGQAQVRAESGRTLQKVAKVLATTEQVIQVEGYTDNMPIKTSQFPSNWELSAARASSVVRLLIDNGVAEPRLSVIGYGPNRPVMDNTTPAGRARNRRVTVMILSQAVGKSVDVAVGGVAPKP